MSDITYDGHLLIDPMSDPRISEEEAQQLKPILNHFVESYIANKDKMSIQDWLNLELGKSLPDYSADEIHSMSGEILSTLQVSEDKHKALMQAIQAGQSKEAWFAKQVKEATSHLEVQQAGQYLQGLDSALDSANRSLLETLQTKTGLISQNPSLDGFIAEQYHAQTFNLNAEATGSPYRAKVLKPTGKGYAKNSVDIVIVDANGKIVRRYQSKYCKDAASTLDAYKNGNYRGQQKLVPADQNEQIAAKTTDVLMAPDGTTSNKLTKDQAKALQEEAQSGKWNDLNWNEFKTKDLAIGIGKQAGQAALMGAAIGAGMNIASKIYSGEDINATEVVEDALKSGADFGIKAAASGAIKVASEKGILTIVPKGTPVSTISNVVFVGIENVKVLQKIATGELSPKEGCDKMQQVTVSTVAGIVASAKGAAVGAKIGAVFGPVGAAVGGFVGGTVAYMAGSAVGQKVVTGYQKVRDKVYEGVKTVCSRISTGIKERVSGLRDFLLGWA